jgi:hypothetical protein
MVAFTFFYNIEQARLHQVKLVMESKAYAKPILQQV